VTPQTASWQSPTPVPAGSLAGRDLLELDDLGADGLGQVLDLARRLRSRSSRAHPARPLAGRVVALLFRKASTRTRVTFEAAAARLGGTSLFLRDADLQLTRGETVEDSARVLSGYVDMLVIRTHAHSEVEAFARHASVPVVNALTDRAHPTQAIADLLTMQDAWGDLRGHRAAYVGDGNNMANSYLFAAALTGLHLTIGCPEGYEPAPEIVDAARSLAGQTGARLAVTHDADEAVAGADAVITDVWTSMGHEAEQAVRRKVFAPFAVTEARMALAAPDAIFLHCLPAHRGEEVDAAVIDGPQSRVFPEAHNRLWVEEAILLSLLGDGE
jgi:ornithine carbamoyltransferase